MIKKLFIILLVLILQTSCEVSLLKKEIPNKQIAEAAGGDASNASFVNEPILMIIAGLGVVACLFVLVLSNTYYMRKRVVQNESIKR